MEKYGTVIVYDCVSTFWFWLHAEKMSPTVKKSKFGALEVPIRPCTRLSLSHNSTVRFFPRVESYPLVIVLNTHIWSLWDFIPYETVWGMFDNYSLVNIQKAIEHGHRNSGFTHWKWWFSIVMLSLPEGMKKGSKNKSSNGWLDQIHCSCVQASQGKVDGPITEQKGPARHSCLLMWSTMSASCMGV